MNEKNCRKHCDQDLYDDIINELDGVSEGVLEDLKSFSITLPKSGLNYMPGNIIGCNAASVRSKGKNTNEELKNALEKKLEEKFPEDKGKDFLYNAVRDIEKNRQKMPSLIKAICQNMIRQLETILK